MAVNQLERLQTKFEAIEVTSRRVHEADLVPAIVDASTEPAVATPFRDVDVSLDETSIVVDPTPAEVWSAHTGITEAAFAVTEYGSIYLPNRQDGSEFLSLFVDRHIAILRAENVVSTMEAAFARLGDALPASRSSGIIATGPSATADMGELVIGAHGPESVHVIIVAEA